MTRLAVYLMAGRETPVLAEAAVDAGADIVEIGFPYSDPLADGPIIRRAAEKALAAGMTVDACLECVAAVRRRVDVDLVPMTYAALLEARGSARFARDVAEAGGTSLIVADLPVDAAPSIRRVHLVAPTTPTPRIALAAERTDGWLYLVSVTGTTGARAELSAQLPPLVARARTVTSVPLFAGFGIATPDHAAAVARIADGIVVGSAAVEAAERGGATELRRFVRGLRRALDGTAVVGT